MCYLLGCDFNKRIKGIGKKKALELMTKYQTLDKVVEYLDSVKNPDGTNKYDTSTLNHDKCRELLTPKPSGFANKTELLNVTPEDYDEDLEKYNLRSLFETLLSRTRNFKPAENVPKN
jgi:5'-3' exonuclease